MLYYSLQIKLNASIESLFQKDDTSTTMHGTHRGLMPSEKSSVALAISTESFASQNFGPAILLMIW